MHHAPNTLLDRFAAQTAIEAAWADRNLLEEADTRAAIDHVIEELDKGHLRVAEPPAEEGGEWTINEWVKKAVILYFPIRRMQTQQVGPFEYHDKMELKSDYALQQVRVVPPATARYGAFLAPGVILMPSYVNIGAYVGAGTMVDTWATVGSCAQVGAGVHLSGGVGLGGVLEPMQAAPVIVEDGAFVGSRCIVVEGVRVGREAVLGANVVLTASTPIIDVTGEAPVEVRGAVPPRAVVVPGTRMRGFAAGEYGLPAALIIGHRRPATDLKVSLNQVLREHAVPV